MTDLARLVPDRKKRTVARRTGPVGVISAAVGPGVRWIILTSVGLFFTVPMLWLLVAPTKTGADLRERHPLSIGSPGNVADTWSNLMEYQDGIVLTWWWKSLIYSSASTVIAVAVAVLAGYAFGTMSFRFRKALLWVTLVVMIVPASATVLPIFLSVSRAGLVNTAWSVIVPLAFFPFGVYLAYIYFAVSVPRSLLEAARLDRASEWRVFHRIALPHAKPLIGLLSFLSFTFVWAQFFLPFVMLSGSQTYNLPVGLNVMARTTPAFFPLGASQSTIGRPEMALAGLMLVLPVGVVFLAAQKYVTRGAFVGAVKG